MRHCLAGLGPRRPLLTRVRQIFLGYALVMLVLDACFIAFGHVDGSGLARVGAVFALALLGGWWVYCGSRGHFYAWAEPIEWAIPLFVHALLGFDRGMAVVHGMLFFRGLYGGRAGSLLRIGYAEVVLVIALEMRKQTDTTLTTASWWAYLVVAALLLLVMGVLREALQAHEHAAARERSVAAGAAELAACSNRETVHRVAVDTTRAIAQSAGAADVRVLLAVGSKLQHRLVAFAGSYTAAEQTETLSANALIGRTVNLGVLPDELVGALQCGEPIYLEGADTQLLRPVMGLEPKRGGVLITQLRVGGQDVGALSVAADAPLSAEVRAMVMAWSTQIATSLAGLALTDELTHRAYHDPLTGLANRDLMRQRLQKALAGSSGLTGFLLIDLDRFKQINDELGHQAGDAVIREVAGRIARVTRGADTPARIGGDEFALVLPELPDVAAAERIAARLIRELELPIEAAGHLVSVGASVGIAAREAGSAAAIDDVIGEADLAMYRAKAAGRQVNHGAGAYVVYGQDACWLPVP